MLQAILRGLNAEDGHAITLPGIAIEMTGAILLAIGAVNGQDALTITGGIVLAVGLLVASLLQHVGVEYEIYGRLEKLEGND